MHRERDFQDTLIDHRRCNKRLVRARLYRKLHAIRLGDRGALAPIPGVFCLGRNFEFALADHWDTACSDKSVESSKANTSSELTLEFHADGDGEAGGEFERARVSDTLVDFEAHLLIILGVVLECLLVETDRCRAGDFPGIEFVFDFVDLHVLPKKGEMLVSVDAMLRSPIVIIWLFRCTGEQSHVFGGSDEPEAGSILPLSWFDLEPAVDSAVSITPFYHSILRQLL